MERHLKITANAKERLLRELNHEVMERFDGNKAKAAKALQMGRIQFTNLCNGRDGTTIDKLLQIGAKLGWKIELRIDRKSGEKT